MDTNQTAALEYAAATALVGWALAHGTPDQLAAAVARKTAAGDALWAAQLASLRTQSRRPPQRAAVQP